MPRETLCGIAHANVLTLDQLLAANRSLQKIDPIRLAIGTKVVIPSRPI